MKIAISNVFILLLCLSINSYGKNNPSFKSLFDISKGLVGTSNERALRAAYQALEIAEHTNSNNEISRTYLLLGYIYVQELNYSKGVECYVKALNHSPVDNVYRAKIYIHLADVFREIKNYDKCIVYCDKAISKLVETNNYGLLANAYYYIASAYRSKKQYNLSQHYNSELRKVINKLGESDYYTLAYNQTGLNHLALEHFDSAFVYFTKILEANDSKEGRALGFVNLGYLFLETKDYSKAIFNLQHSIIENDSTQLWLAYLGLSKVYHEKGDIQKAKEYLEQAKKSGGNVYETIKQDSTLKTENYFALKLKFEREREQSENNLFIVNKEVDRVLSRAETDPLSYQMEFVSKKVTWLMWSLAIVFVILVTYMVRNNARIHRVNKVFEKIEDLL